MGYEMHLQDGVQYPWCRMQGKERLVQRDAGYRTFISGCMVQDAGCSRVQVAGCSRMQGTVCLVQDVWYRMQHAGCGRVQDVGYSTHGT